MTEPYEITFKDDFLRFDKLYASVETHLQMMVTGKLRGLIVSGPPGLGKSYSVMEHLEENKKDNFFRVKGKITELSLYLLLYSYRNSGQILVLDDTDDIIVDTGGINLLKAATDSGERTISWESTTSRLGETPSSFIYSGSVVIITNVGTSTPNKRLGQHLKALNDRCSNITISDGNLDNLFKQICYMVINRQILTARKIPVAIQKQMLYYIETNKRKLRTVSLRTVDRMVTYYEVDPSTWKENCDVGLLAF